jgi:hypothetical protein
MELAADQPGRPPSSRRRGFLIPPARSKPPMRGGYLATGAARSHIPGMVKITISPKASAALAATLPLGSVAVEPERAREGTAGFRSCSLD